MQPCVTEFVADPLAAPPPSLLGRCFFLGGDGGKDSEWD